MQPEPARAGPARTTVRMTQQLGAQAGAAAVRQEGDVDHQKAVGPSIQIQPADRLAGLLDDEVVRQGVELGEMDGLQPELIVQERRLHRGGPGDGGHLLGAGRTVERSQKGGVVLVLRAQDKPPRGPAGGGVQNLGRVEDGQPKLGNTPWSAIE